MTTTKLDPRDVLREYDDLKTIPENKIYGHAERLAAALRETLTQIDTQNNWPEITAEVARERDRLRAKLAKAEPVVEAAREADRVAVIVSPERDRLRDALAAYDATTEGIWKNESD